MAVKSQKKKEKGWVRSRVELEYFEQALRQVDSHPDY